MNTLLILGIKMEYSRVFRKKMAPTNDSTGKKRTIEANFIIYCLLILDINLWIEELSKCKCCKMLQLHDHF